MARSSRPPLSRDRAWACVMLNFSISGWGTLKAGYVFAGAAQMLFNIAGIFLVGAWMCGFIYGIFEAEFGVALARSPGAWMWRSGAACIGISWTWMLITCASLMRRSRSENVNQEQKPHNIPPRLSDSDKPPKL